MKTKITTKFLLKEYRCVFPLIAFSIFVLLGLLCLVISFTYNKSFTEILPMLCFMAVIAFLFCFFGLKNIIKIMRKKSTIKNGEYTIVEDFVTYKRMTHKGSSSDNDDSYCQLDFKDYSSKFGKAVCVKRKVYEETKKATNFIWYM